jgi:Zn-dependent protease
VIARGSRFPGSDNPILLIALVLLVFYFFTGGLQGPIANASRDPVAFIGFIVAIVLGITVHEFMHAYAASRLGDDTGRVMGRLSLNPMAHFDLFGTLLLVVAGFGYGKPVPFNESRLRGPFAVSIIALAGPASNFALAAICAVPLRFAGTTGGILTDYDKILLLVVLYNCILGVFNLLPVPPLDGANVVYGFLSPRLQYSWRTYQQYGPFLLLFLLLLGGRFFQIVVFGPAQGLFNLLVGRSGFFF